MNKFKDMMLFCSVVEQGNFAKAAKTLNVTPAIVGRRISAMEESLGFILFNRSTRQMQLTGAGQDYYRGCKQILAQVSELEDDLRTDNQVTPSGLIRISAPDGLTDKLLMSAISEFKHQYPNIHFAISLENHSVDLVEQDIDLAFRLSLDMQDSNYIATKLTETSFGLFASANYLKLHGKPNTINELENHDCIQMTHNRYGGYWLFGQADNITKYRQPWSMTVTNTQGLISAANQDLGIAMIPLLFAEKEPSLVKLEHFTDFPTVGVYAMYPTKQHLPYRMRLFLDFVKLWFKRYNA